MQKPKKLIREQTIHKLKEGEWETIEDQEELNKLYALKIKEELREIQTSGHTDIMEFADLLQAVYSFALQNGFTQEELTLAFTTKAIEKGVFKRTALNNINPHNPSNIIYFEN